MHAVDRWVRLGRRWAIVELALVLGMQALGAMRSPLSWSGSRGWVTRSRWTGPAGAARRIARSRKVERAARRGRVPLMLATAVGLIAVWFITTVILGIALPKLRPAHDGPPTPPLPWITAVSVAVLVAWLAVGNMFLYRWRGRPWRIPLGAMWLGLAISALLATAATAAQLFPIVEFTQQTSRAANAGTHELYAFSIEPYRLIEMIWPNVWGAEFGGNTYWAPLMRLPGSYPKIWVPSLYLGGLTFVLALPVFTLRKALPGVWLSLITIVSIVAHWASTRARSG